MPATALPLIAPSGKMLQVRFVDGSGTPTILKAVGATPPGLSINGGPPVSPAKMAWGSDSTHTPKVPYNTFISYPLNDPALGLTLPLDEAATATLSIVDGTYTTAAGAIAAGTLAVTNMVGGSYVTYDPDAPKTMKVGTNLSSVTNFMVCNFYANLVRQSGGVPSHDALGYPTAFPAATSLVIDGPADPTEPLNYPSAPAGVWTVKWDGDKAANLALQAGTATTVTLLSDVTGDNNIGHTRTYAVTVDTTVRHSPRVNLNFKAAGATNPQVYWAGEPTDGVQLFGANTLRLAAGYKCLRFMNALWTGRSPVVDYTDFPTANQFSYKNGTTGQVGGTVASIGPYEEPDHAFIFNVNWARFLVTFAKPHRAKTGQVLSFSGPIATGTPGGVIATTGGGTSNPLANGVGVVRVIDDLTLATEHYVPGTGGGGTMTRTVNQPAGVTFTASIRQGMPVEHCALLSNAVGADCWINVPPAATDDCVAQMAATILANLTPGLKCYCEPGNEHWNTNNGFEHNEYYRTLGSSLPGYTGSGQEGTAHAVVTGTSVSALVIDTPGSYAMAPQVTMPLPPPGGQPAKAHATLINGTLSLVLDSGGFGYSPTSPPHVTLTAAQNVTPAYVWRGAHQHAIFKAAFDAAGRSADLVRVLGGQYESPNGVMAPLINAAAWNGIDFDALAMAPYYDNNLGLVLEPNMVPAFNLMDADMLHDLAQLAMIDGVFFNFAGQIRALLDGAGFSHVKMVTYECSIQNGIPTGSNVAPGNRTRAFGRHPRMRELYLFWLKKNQDSGIDLDMDFLLFSTTFGWSNWAKYLGYGMLPGLGDGSDGLNDNRAEYLDMSRFVSVMGEALNTWNGSAPPPPPPPPARHRPRALPTARLRSLPRR